ncbi:hypothetical protein DL767_000936 [Monosporascus sp. MG133]|nr:hypothetical protein DL767_000936 [Monosporascus sp. MG133]
MVNSNNRLLSLKHQYTHDAIIRIKTLLVEDEAAEAILQGIERRYRGFVATPFVANVLMARLQFKITIVIAGTFAVIFGPTIEDQYKDRGDVAPQKAVALLSRYMDEPPTGAATVFAAPSNMQPNKLIKKLKYTAHLDGAGTVPGLISPVSPDGTAGRMYGVSSRLFSVL